MPVTYSHATPESIMKELSHPDVMALVTLRKCKNDCGHLHGKTASHPSLDQEDLVSDIHRAAFRLDNPDVPDPDNLITVSIAHIEGIPHAPDGRPNALVQISGDTDTMTPHDIIEGLEELVARLKEQHGAPAEHPDANGAYL